MSSDPALLTQIFLNYDCDFDSMNLYKEIVHMLTKLGGKATSAPMSVASQRAADQEHETLLGSNRSLGDDNESYATRSRFAGCRR